MKLISQLLVLMSFGLCCMSTAQAVGNYVQSAGTQHNGVYASQYNPWRPQPKQWGYQNKQRNGNAYTMQPRNVLGQPAHAAPLNYISARRYEYRRYVQEVNPHYDMNGGLPWWAGSGAAPYGPWAIGNGWPNGLW